jgi:hypothetical protein
MAMALGMLSRISWILGSITEICWEPTTIWLDEANLKLNTSTHIIPTIAILQGDGSCLKKVTNYASWKDW